MPTKNKSSRSTRPVTAASPAAQPAPAKQAVAPETPATSSDTPAAAPVTTVVPIGDLRDAPFVASDRLPAMDAIRQCLEQTGGPAALCTADGAAALDVLGPRERAFALLVASVAIHGVEEPLSVRSTPGGLEIVDGLRRFHAASLAGVREVPVRIRTMMSEEEAAGYAGRVNKHRAALSSWQLARLAGATRAEQAAQAEGTTVPEKPRRRGAPRRADSAANVARVLGISYSMAKDYLMILAAITDEVLAKIAPNPVEAHAALSALSFRKLRTAARTKDEAERVQKIRVAAKLERVVKPTTQRVGVEFKKGTDGAYTLRVHHVDRLTRDDAERLLEFLRQEEARVEERIAQLVAEHATKRKREQRRAA